MTAVTEQELIKHQAERQGKRVTLEGLEANIKAIDYYTHPGSQLTICIITLLNGFTVTGESACADPKMFNREIGERISQDNAKKKIWPLMGYALKQELFLLGSAEGKELTFQDRVRIEERELDDKIAKLTAFIDGDTQFYRLAQVDQDNLSDQLHDMKKYQHSLQRRIDRF